MTVLHYHNIYMKIFVLMGVTDLNANLQKTVSSRQKKIKSLSFILLFNKYNNDDD